MNASNVFSQVVSAARSVCAEGTQVGLLPRMCLQVMAQMLAAISTMEDLTAHRTHQGQAHGLEREHSHPSGYQVPLHATVINKKSNFQIRYSIRPLEAIHLQPFIYM